MQLHSTLHARGSGGMPPQENFEIDALRLNLVAFLDSSVRVSRILGNGNGKREREAGTGKVEICFKRSIPHLFTIHIELNS